MRKLLYILLIAILAPGIVACKKTSPHSAQAKTRGLKCAYELLKIPATDTLALERSLINASAERSKYLLDNDTIAAHDFDRAYKKAVQRGNPQLAKEIFD